MPPNIAPKPAPNYLAGYDLALVQQVRQLIDEKRLGEIMLGKYPNTH